MAIDASKLTPEQLRRQMTQISTGPLVDPRQQAIDDGYKPGSGFMYEDKFYASGNPGRSTMDMAPLDMLLQENPAAKAAFEAGGNQMVMNPNPTNFGGNANLGGPGQPIQTPGGIGRPATNESAMGNIGTGQPIYNDPMPGNPFAGISPSIPEQDAISVHNIDDQGNITGQTGFSRVVARYGNISDLSSFSPELQAAIQGYQGGANQNSALQLPIRPGEPGSPSYPGTQGGPGINQGILNPINNQGGGQPVDGSGVGIGNMMMPLGHNPNGGSSLNGFGIEATGNSALPGMPTPNNPTGTTGSSHSHNDLIQGIGNLLQQYMPNAAANAQKTLGQTTPTINNQPFPSMTNNNQGLFGTGVANSFSNNFNNATQPQQVFGNMITPMGRQN